MAAKKMGVEVRRKKTLVLGRIFVIDPQTHIYLDRSRRVLSIPTIGVQFQPLCEPLDPFLVSSYFFAADPKKPKKKSIILCSQIKTPERLKYKFSSRLNLELNFVEPRVELCWTSSWTLLNLVHFCISKKDLFSRHSEIFWKSKVLNFELNLELNLQLNLELNLALNLEVNLPVNLQVCFLFIDLREVSITFTSCQYWGLPQVFCLLTCQYPARSEYYSQVVSLEVKIILTSRSRITINKKHTCGKPLFFRRWKYHILASQ